MRIMLTKSGIEKCNEYIEELNAKRKEILDAEKDTAYKTILPTIKNIEEDINWSEIDGEYLENWGVTDHYEGDYPINLKNGIDYCKGE